MHELSVAISIVEIAKEEAMKAGSTHVEEIVLEIGKLTCIEEEALLYAWQEAIKNTVLQHATCAIEYIEGRAICITCNKEFALTSLYDLCPICQYIGKEIIQGKELRIKSMVII